MTTMSTKDLLNRLTSNTDLKRSVNIAQSTEDRLNLVRQHLLENDLGFLNQFQTVRNIKDYHRSLAAKNAANVEFGAKKCHSALLKTNEGLSLAPTGSDLLPVLYGNRSAILFDLKHYQDCLENIELALREQCPLNLKLKLLFRKAKCLQCLNEIKKAEKVFHESLQELETILRNDIGDGERKQYEELRKKMEKSWKDVLVSLEKQRAQERLFENEKERLQKGISENKGVPGKNHLQERIADIKNVSLETNVQDRLPKNESQENHASKERLPNMKDSPRDKTLLEVRTSKIAGDTSSTPSKLNLLNINPIIPVASNSVTLSYSNSFGRSVTAVEDISPGEILIVEPPTVSVLRPETLFRLTHCHACLSRCVNRCIPCNTCDVLYCNVNCKMRSNESHHRTECWTLHAVKQMEVFGIVEMLALRFVLQETKQGQDVGELWRKTVLAAAPTTNGNEIPQTVAMANVNGVPHTTRTSKNEVFQELSSENEVLRDFPSLVYQLETNDVGRETSDRITRAVKALILCELLRLDGVFQDSRGEYGDAKSNFPTSSSGCNGVPKLPVSDRSDCDDDVTGSTPSTHNIVDRTRLSGSVLQFACLLVHYFQAVACNAHDINTFFSSLTAGIADQVQIGSGLYPFCSMINHACDPNVVRHSQGTTIIVTALKKIHRGEQLFDNYGVHYATHPKPDRQNYLSSQYRFNCACVACNENYPLFTPAVQGASLMFHDDVIVSPVCNNGIIKSAELFNDILNEMVNSSHSCVENVNEKLSVVIGYMKLLNEYVRGPRQEFEKCQETYKRLMCYVTNCVMLQPGEQIPE